MLHRLVYISLSNIERKSPEMTAIARVAQERNAVSGVTGYLYHDGTHFAQVLEGLDLDVGQIYASIQADPRHRSVTTLSYQAVDKRAFGSWHMGFNEPEGGMDRLPGLPDQDDTGANLGEADADAVLDFMRRLGRGT